MRDDNKLYREKRYVEVDVRFTPDGKIRPLAINYDKSSYLWNRPCFGCQAWHIAPWREGAVLHLPDLRAEAESLA